jgi:hypothetical protein
MLEMNHFQVAQQHGVSWTDIPTVNCSCTESRRTRYSDFSVVTVTKFTSIHTVQCMSDYRRGLDWWSDLLNTLQMTVTHRLMFSVTSSLSLLVSGFQRQTFPLPLGSQTVPSLSYQLLTATAHKDWNPAVISLTHKPTYSTDSSLVLLIQPQHGPRKNHRSSVAVQLLPWNCCVRVC